MRLTKLLERVLSAIPVAIGVAVLAFMFLRFLPGDPVEIMLGETQVTQQQIDSLRNQLNLDKPLITQLALFLAGVLRGDLGVSFVKNAPVVKLIADTLPATIELTMATVLVAILIALPVGIISALRAGSIVDRSVLSGALVGVSMPAFWFGLLLILLFAVELKLFPTSGRIAATMVVDRTTGFMLIDTLLAKDLRAFGVALKHLVLPAITLGVVFAAVLARVIRASMLEVLSKDFVTTARAKGLREWSVIIKHALRNALIPALTVTGLQFGELLGGNMIVETIFAWPGLGRLVVSSIFARDYVVVQAAVMLYALTYVAANLVVDALYTLLNPRISL
ncbi:MAG TPA: ABC transporter permease [Trueperaceae bacterium]|nr:ABC transporter permease [Trueperaceae bacterium]HRP46710.1 ABC transporter permease [Trueperaceae bacterium]